MTHNLRNAQSSIHDQQYQFWSSLQQTNLIIYKLKPHKLHYYYLSKRLTKKPFQLRLDVYFDESNHKDNGYQSFTICGISDNGLNKNLINKIKKEFGFNNIEFNGDKYPNCYVIINKDPKYMDNISLMIEWFNNYVYKLINIVNE